MVKARNTFGKSGHKRRPKIQKFVHTMKIFSHQSSYLSISLSSFRRLVGCTRRLNVFCLFLQSVVFCFVLFCFSFYYYFKLFRIHIQLNALSLSQFVSLFALSVLVYNMISTVYREFICFDSSHEFMTHFGTQYWHTFLAFDNLLSLVLLPPSLLINMSHPSSKNKTRARESK